VWSCGWPGCVPDTSRGTRAGLLLDRMRPVRWLRESASELLPLVIAIAVPLAGLVLALQVAATGDRRRGLRIGAATVLGACVWAAVLTA
jgi:hypothetical protein